MDRIASQPSRHSLPLVDSIIPWSARLLFCLGMLAVLAPLAAQYGNAEDGARLLEEQRCTTCHPIAGRGGGAAPDLARRSSESFTPATLAASMWNHGPAMWKAMQAQEMEVPALTPVEIMDLYAYFFALRYFEPAGDAARGKEVFTAKNCNRCHALVATESGALGPPVSQWSSLGNPVLFIQNMWNHGSEMANQFQQQGLSWPQFTVREMADLLVYVRNIPEAAPPAREPTLRFGQARAGEEVFENQHCLNCHTFGFDDPSMVDLAQVSRRENSLTGIAVAMWNHRPIMAKARSEKDLEMKAFKGEEMAQLVGYLFEENYFDPLGDAERGENTFQAKGCGSCHGQADSRAPTLRGTGGGYTATTLASAIWRHGPNMAAEFERQGKEWPALTQRDVVNLISYLNRR